MTDDMQANGFSPAEADLLRDLLDEIVPPSADGRLPGAGALGLARHIMAAVEQNLDLRPTIVQGLATVRQLGERAGAGSFKSLAPSERARVLAEVETAEPAFVPTLTFHTYVAYYQNPNVLEGLGLDPRPPHPRGHEMPTDDLSLLNVVRRRSPFFRRPRR